MSVEDIASQSSVVFETRYTALLKGHNFRVHVNVCPDSAETLVRRGGIAYHLLIAYSLSDISAKNYQNQLMCITVQHQCRFLDTVHTVWAAYSGAIWQMSVKINYFH